MGYARQNNTPLAIAMKTLSFFVADSIKAVKTANELNTTTKIWETSPKDFGRRRQITYEI